jgi:hypothetical protein
MGKIYKKNLSGWGSFYKTSKNYALRRKSERNARRPRSSAKARAISIGVNTSFAAAGLRPMAVIAPKPIRPIAIPGPIIASIAIPLASATYSIEKNERK